MRSRRVGSIGVKRRVPKWRMSLLVRHAEQGAGEPRPPHRDHQDREAVTGVERHQRRLRGGDERLGRRPGHEEIDPGVALARLIGHAVDPGPIVQFRDLRRAGDVPQPGQQGVVVGAGGRREVGDRFQQRDPAAVGRGEEPAGEVVEPTVTGESPCVPRHGREVGVDEVEDPDVGRGGDEAQRRPGDDGALPLARQRGLEEIAPLARGAGQDLARAGDDLQRQDVIDLRAVAEAHPADAADREGATDREVEVVGQHRRRQPARQRRRQQRPPAQAGADCDAIGADRPERRQRAQIDDDPAGRLRLAVGGVPRTPRDDAQAVAAGEADHPGDVLDRIPAGGRPTAARARSGRNPRRRPRGSRRPGAACRRAAATARTAAPSPRRSRDPGAGRGVEADHQRAGGQRFGEVPTRERVLRDLCCHPNRLLRRLERESAAPT